MENLNLNNWLHNVKNDLNPKDQDLVGQALTLLKMAGSVLYVDNDSKKCYPSSFEKEKILWPKQSV